jgi:hypothetical protein
LISGSVNGVITGTYDECGGTLTQTWTFTDDCDRTITHVQTITVQPAPIAVWINPPGNITISCDDATAFAASSLSYSNAGLGGCLIEGQLLGVITGTYDECGGTLTQTWTFTDDCDRTITHVQTITVQPAPIAVWINPPGNITISCDDATAFAASSLSYSNAGLGGCLIEGQLLGVITGTYDECGGTLTQTWTFTDDCDRTITHVQTITVQPAPIAVWINPPGNITISCDDATAFAASSLSYSNAGLGDCLISGQVLGLITGSYDECGGTLTQTWTFTDDCNRTITHVQTITVQPAPVAAFINPPADITISCDQATTFTSSSLSYSNAGLGGCLISGSVNGVITGSYDECGGTLTQTWTFTDDCDRTITHTQTITVQPAPVAVWINPPGNITISCDDATAFAASSLSYSNAGLGGCLTSGSVNGVIAGTYDECGGTLTQTWTFTDDCNRTITHVQTIIVQPAPVAAWINPPGNITISCDQATSFAASSLSYTNAGLGGCLISGSVNGVITGTYDECGGILTQTWTFTDDCDRQIQHVQTITVEPAPIAAFINPPAEITISCDQATAFAASSLSYSNAGLGGCIIQGEVLGLITGSYNECGGELIQTWTFTDDCGRVIEHVQTITIDPAPQAAWIDAPANITIFCDQATTFAASSLSYSNSALGGCIIQGEVMGIITGAYNDCGDILLQTWTFTDACGRTISHSQIITLLDSTPPVWDQTMPESTTVECNNVPEIPTGITATDNCDPNITVIFSETREDGDCEFNYELIRTWTATDNCGNETVHTQIITVQDTTPPTILCPGNIMVNADEGEDFATIIIPLPFVSDNCGTFTFVNDFTGTENASGNYPLGVTTVTYTATDECGNVATCEFTVTVQDEEAPVITCPETITVSCIFEVPEPYASYAEFEAAGGFATDNNEIDEDSFILLSETSDNLSCPETITRTYQISDFDGNTATCEQIIIVIDLIDPTWDQVMPANITVECDAVPDSPAVLTASDNCDTDVPVVFTEVRTDGTCADSYTLTRTWTATDNCENETIHVQVITVEDTTAPVFVEELPQDQTVECDEVPAAVTLTATDNCGTAIVSIEEVRTDGDCPFSYFLTRTWTATDECGNETTHVQVITVEDTTAPVWDQVMPVDITVECDGVPAAPAVVTASDNCDADVTVVFGEVRTDGACEDTYTLTRTWTATDNCGNSITHVQVISVEDTTAPVWDQVMPADITVECDALPAAPAVVTASDNCDSNVLVEFTEARTDGVCPDTYTLTRTWTATDNCGNSITHVQVISVEDTSAPVWDQVMPVDITVECDALPAAPAVVTASDNCDSDVTVVFGEVRN